MMRELWPYLVVIGAAGVVLAMVLTPIKGVRRW
jgi:hypothetical protein